MRRPSRKHYDSIWAEHVAAGQVHAATRAELRELGRRLAETDPMICRTCGMPAVREAPFDGENGSRRARRTCRQKHRWDVEIEPPPARRAS